MKININFLFNKFFFSIYNFFFKSQKRLTTYLSIIFIKGYTIYVYNSKTAQIVKSCSF